MFNFYPLTVFIISNYGDGSGLNNSNIPSSTYGFSELRIGLSAGRFLWFSRHYNDNTGTSYVVKSQENTYYFFVQRTFTNNGITWNNQGQSGDAEIQMNGTRYNPYTYFCFGR